MDDPVETYRAASQRNDVDALIATLAPDVELVSPVSGRMVFRGHDDLRVLLAAIYGSLRDLTWDEHIRDGSTHVLVGGARIAGLRLTDAMVMDVGDDGLIHRIRPHLRPWFATTALALRLAPAIRPGMVLRALRS